jgi:MAF protein
VTRNPIVLASSSPYRRELLAKLRLPFVSAAPAIDETQMAGESADALAVRLAYEKAWALADDFPDHLIIGSDQVVQCGTACFGKPGTRERARQQLAQASGNIVSFFSAVCVLDTRVGLARTSLDETRVHFRALSTAQIERYIELDRPMDCAGAFKSESLGIALVRRIEGDDPNALIGLPLVSLTELLEQFGVSVL